MHSIRLLPVAIACSLLIAAPAFAGPDQNPAALRAKRLIEGASAKAVFRADADAFLTKAVVVDSDGTEHVRLERTYRGLPVFGGDLMVHSRGGKLKSASTALRFRSRPEIVPRISKDEAIVIAGAAFKGKLSSVPVTSLMVYARNTTPTLAYRVHVLGDRDNDQAEGNIVYYIDARSGAILLEDDQIHTAAGPGTGRTLNLGDVTITTDSYGGAYLMQDPSRGYGMTMDALNGETITNSLQLFSDADNIWGNNTNADRASAAADVHYGVAATWDYYKNAHGRDGIFNNGKGVKSYVHFGNNYSNAYWQGYYELIYYPWSFQYTGYMVYGDGDGVNRGPFVSLDVIGHEMTHGVTGATSGLGYYNIKDSGGLNEASSDIMGTLVEFYANNPNDPGDYLIGEEVYVSNPTKTKAFRRMFDQAYDGRSFNCYPIGGFAAEFTGPSGKYGPHYTSGVANRFFYLLAEGAVSPANFSYTPSQLVCNGDTGVTGIGRDKAGKIWYRAMNIYFVSNTDYPAARVATLQAAADLYGVGSTEHNAVARAWSAVLVN